MPCKVEIEKNIREDVEKRSEEGLGKSLLLAKKLAREINSDYGEKVVAFHETHDAVEREVNIPKTLIDRYHANELKLEQGELEKDATKSVKERETDLGIDQHGDSKFDQLGQTAPQEVAPKTIDTVKDFLDRVGIKWSQAKDLGEAGEEKIIGIADILKKTIEVVQGERGLNALPEESMHFIVEALQQKSPELYKELDRQINRYQIYDEVMKTYKGKQGYVTKEGRPDFPKLREEAITQLLTGMVINNDLADTDAKVNTAKKWWARAWDQFKALFKGVDNPFKDAFEETAAKAYDKDFILPEDIQNLSQALKFMHLEKGEDLPEKAEKLFDFFKKTNKDGFFSKVQRELPDGTQERYYNIAGQRIYESVTDHVKKQMPEFAPRSLYGKVKDEFSRRWGVAVDDDLTEIVGRLIDPTTGKLLSDPVLFSKMGTTPKEGETLSDQQKHFYKTNLGGFEKELRGRNTVMMKDTYEHLENFTHEFMKSFPPDTRFLTQHIIADTNSKKVIPGTVDFMAILPDATVRLYDWKTIDAHFWNLETGTTVAREDVAWYKVKSYDLQLSKYKDIISNKESIYSKHLETKIPGKNPLPFTLKVTEARAIPIIASFGRRIKDSARALTIDNTFYDLVGIQLGKPGNVDTWRILMQVPVHDELTDNNRLNSIIKALDQVKSVLEGTTYATKAERQAKFRELERLYQAKRDLQIAKHLGSTANTLILTLNRLNRELTNADFSTMRKNIEILEPLSGLRELTEDAYKEQIDKQAQYEADLEKAQTHEEKKRIRATLDDIEGMKATQGKMGEVGKGINALLEQYQRKMEMSLQELADSKGIANFSTIQKQISGSWFREESLKGKSASWIKSVQLYNTLYQEAYGKQHDETSQWTATHDLLLKNLDTFAKANGMKLKDALQLLLSDKTLDNKELKFVPRIKGDVFEGAEKSKVLKEKGYFSSRDEVLESKNLETISKWFKENTDFNREGFEKYRDGAFKNFDSQEFDLDPIKDKQERDKIKQAFLETYDPETKVDGKLSLKAYQNTDNHFIRPKDQWKTDKFKYIENNKPLLDLYQHYRGLIDEAEELGLVDAWGRNRTVPSFQRELSFGEKFNPLVMPGRMAMGIIDRLYSEDHGVEKKNALGERIFRVSAPNTDDLGVWKTDSEGNSYKDYSYVSKDLQAIFNSFAQSVIMAKHKIAVEDASRLILMHEELKHNKNYQKAFGEQGVSLTAKGTVEETRQGDLQTKLLNETEHENAKYLKHVIFNDLYNYTGEVGLSGSHKDKISALTAALIKAAPRGQEFLDRFTEKGGRFLDPRKILVGLDRYAQLDVMGFNYQTALANLTHGLASLSLEHDVADMAMPVTPDGYKKFAALSRYFDAKVESHYITSPEDARDLTGKYKQTDNGWAYAMMRGTDNGVQNSALLAHLRNSTVVDGKIVNILSYVRYQATYDIGGEKVKYSDRENLDPNAQKDLLNKANALYKDLKANKNLFDLVKITEGKDGKSEANFEGVDPRSKTTRDFRNETQVSIKNALGAVSESDKYMLKTHWASNLLMTFRGRLPWLWYQRFGGFRLNTTTGKFDVGKFKIFANNIRNEFLGSTLGLLHNNFWLNSLEKVEKYGSEAHISELYNALESDMYHSGRIGSREEAQREMPTIDEFRELYARKLSSSYAEMRVLGMAFMYMMASQFTQEDETGKTAIDRALGLASKKWWERMFFFNPATIVGIYGQLVPFVSVVWQRLFPFAKHSYKYITSEDETKSTKEGKAAIKSGLKAIPYAGQAADVMRQLDPQYGPEELMLGE